MAGRIVVNERASLLAFARPGLGLAYVADFEAAEDLAKGRLESVYEIASGRPRGCTSIFRPGLRLNLSYAHLLIGQSAKGWAPGSKHPSTASRMEYHRFMANDRARGREICSNCSVNDSAFELTR